VSHPTRDFVDAFAQQLFELLVAQRGQDPAGRGATSAPPTSTAFCQHDPRLKASVKAYSWPPDGRGLDAIGKRVLAAASGSCR
jgi:hypothetical protein